jgi:UDP-N-acetylglucosamine 1-carboxyvinyltransferase
LQRCKKAIVPNPEGCRLGARPIERHIEGLEKMGAKISYKSEDGYYHATANEMLGTTYTFEKNTHTGTETLIMASVMAKGTTVLNNAAEEHEIDDLILLLNKMGAKIERMGKRKIVITGVKKLHGTTHTIVSDSNELVTFAVLSLLSGGNISLKDYNLSNIKVFLDELYKVGGKYEERNGKVRFFYDKRLLPSNITTGIEPGFKTDWQGPWAILMTQAEGNSTIHETIYESRFGYVSELKKMGAKISFYSPKVENPEKVYNFNFEKDVHLKQGIKIKGPQKLHNAIINISDLRAGATVVIAALIARGESVIYGIEHLERGYEDFVNRLKSLGADIKEVEDDF